ncbi:MAG: TonB-dependent receptor [Alphaproteobacteria bacterium]|nr:TonB-dependent receptor [Alphaproteobacteria bacterium]
MRALLRSPILLLLAAPAWADPGELDEAEADDTVIVYEPDGTPRVAGSANVVTEEELERFEYDDIGRVLSATPGVYVRGEDGFGLRPNIGLRGANSDRSAKITLLEDGVPLTPAPYAAPAAYYFPMATRMVGVEVFKGPAAIQHGPQTVGGAINLLTRRVPLGGPDGMVDFAYGMRNTAKLHAWAGTGTERAGIVAEVTHLGTDGFKHLPDGGPTGFQRTDLMLKARVASDPALATRHALTLKLGWGQEHSHETYLGLHVDDYADDPYQRYAASALDDMQWRRTQVEATWQLDLSRAVRIRTTAYHHWLGRQWFKLNQFRSGPSLHGLLQSPEGGQSAVYLAILRGEQDPTTPDQALMLGTNDRAFHSFGVQTRVRWRVRSGVVDSQLEAGVRVHGDVVDRLHTQGAFYPIDGRLKRDDTPLETTLDAHTTATALAAHVQEDLEIGAVHLLPGVRTEIVRTAYRSPDEDTDALRAVVLPGFGALVEPLDGLQVFGGVYRGFSPVAPGQPAEVRPETSISSELGVRLGSIGSRAEIVGFVNDYQNLTGQCTFSGGCAGTQIDTQYNGGKAWVYGVEGVAEKEWLLPGRLRVPVSASYTWTESRFRTGFVSGFPQFGTVEPGDRLPYVPGHQAGARLALEHDRFGFGVGASARSGMRDMAGQDPLGPTDVPAQALVDLNASVRPTDQLAIYSTVVNATNTHVLESWRPFGARPTAPFQLMVGIKVRP